MNREKALKFFTILEEQSNAQTLNTMPRLNSAKTHTKNPKQNTTKKPSKHTDNIKDFCILVTLLNISSGKKKTLRLFWMGTITTT